MHTWAVLLQKPKISQGSYPIRILTYLLTPWSRVLFEKLTSSQVVKKFPAFYGTRKFITTFTSASHRSEIYLFMPNVFIYDLDCE